MSLEDFKYNLTALKKCNQYWDEMKPVDGGRLCGSCEKKIVDFSHMTHTEIALFMAESKEPVCGFYLPEQLPHGKTKKAIPVAVGLSALIASSLISKANSLPPDNLYAHVDSPEKSITYNEQQEPVFNKQTDSIIITGKVISLDTATKQTAVVPFAAVIVKGTKTGVSCNKNGEFTLHYQPFADSGIIKILISAVGQETTEVTVPYNGQQEYNVGTITLYQSQLTEFYVTIRRPWHQRLWRKLTKPFRR